MTGRERNKPCPCGSGRKRKKCHPGGAPESPEAPRPARDPLSAKFLQFYSQNSHQIEIYRKALLRTASAEIASMIGTGLIPPATAVDKLDEIVAAIVPASLRETLVKKNPYFWLAPYRRMSTKGFLTTLYQRPFSAILSKTYGNHLIYQYSDHLQVVNRDLGNDPNYEPEDFMAIYAIEVYGSVLQDLSASIKLCAKGCSLRATPTGFEVIKTPAFFEQISEFDDRREKDNHFLNVIGLKNLEVFQLSQTEEALLKGSQIAAVRPNVESMSFDFMGNKVIDPQLIPIPIDIAELYRTLRSVETAFKEIVGQDCKISTDGSHPISTM